MLFLLTILAITSCASKPHVLLFTANLSENDEDKIIRKLKLKNIKFTTSEVPFPESINSNSIIYNPWIGSSKKVTNIIDVLSSEGFNISWFSIFRVGNHSFTAQNIGLYIFSEEYNVEKENVSPFLVKEYGSRECSSVLTLNDDSTFKVDFELWESELDDYRIVSVTGLWNEHEPMRISLQSIDGSKEVIFERKITSSIGDYGKETTVSLLPISDTNENNFYVVDKSKLLDLRCHFYTNILT